MNIDIKTPNGYMLIDPDKFFPASKSDLKDLLKIINHPVTGEGAEKIQECIDYLEQQIYSLKEDESDYTELNEVLGDLTTDEFSTYYYKQHNKLIDKILEMIRTKKLKYQSNIEQLRGGIRS